MSDGIEQINASVQSNEQAMAVLEKLFRVAEPDSVFSDPITSGDYTVITCSEVTVGMGLGFGTGEGESPEEGGGRGGGGGGGGASSGRPVAAISVGPAGVHVEPIVDPTKIALAFFTTLGAMFMMLGNMRRAARK